MPEHRRDGPAGAHQRQRLAATRHERLHQRRERPGEEIEHQEQRVPEAILDGAPKHPQEQQVAAQVQKAGVDELAGEQRQQLGPRHVRIACQRREHLLRHRSPLRDEAVECRPAQRQLVREDEDARANEPYAHQRLPPTCQTVAERDHPGIIGRPPCLYFARGPRGWRGLRPSRPAHAHPRLGRPDVGPRGGRVCRASHRPRRHRRDRSRRDAVRARSSRVCGSARLSSSGHPRRGGHDQRGPPAGAVHRGAAARVLAAATDGRVGPRARRPERRGASVYALDAFADEPLDGTGGRSTICCRPSRCSTPARPAARPTRAPSASPTSTACLPSAPPTPTCWA